MKNPLSLLKLSAAALTISSLVCLPAITRAAPVALYLNSSLSYLDASGVAFGLNFAPQAAGSMRAYYSGIIAADYTAGVFTFTGGSLITALNNPAGPFSSVPYPGGPWPGNYGVTAGPTFIPTYNFVVINGVYSGLTLDLTSGTAKNAVAPTGVTDNWTGGSLNWGAANAVVLAGPYAPLSGGASSMAGVFGANTSAALVTFDGTTLTVPITFHTTGANRSEDWTGQLVATIPEPSTLALAVIGVLGLVGFQSLRSRRNH
jgi:hypothetical protein